MIPNSPLDVKSVSIQKKKSEKNPLKANAVIMSQNTQ